MAVLAMALSALVTYGAGAQTVLRGRLNADILSLDPGVRRDENTDAVVLHLVEGLVAFREDGSIGPLLAQSWTVSDDGRTYRFALRPGILFHNGATLTADDVVWSLKRYLAPATRWRCRFEFGAGGITGIEDIAAPDPGTVLVTLSRATPFFLKILARPDCGGAGILHRDSWGADGALITPIGTGPFRLGEWRRNQFIELDRFDRYAALPGDRDGNAGNRQALVDKVRFLIIPDGSAARAALLRGNLDVLDALSPAEVAGVQGQPGIRVEINPTMDFYELLFQTHDPLLSDVRMRRAIALAIDTAGLTRAVTWGTARANASPVPVVSPYYGPVEAQPRPKDVAEARRLTAEAGYTGQPIRLITNRRYPQMFDSAVLIQAMAAEAGINVEIETLDWATQLDRYAKGDYQMMAFAFSARLDPSLNFGSIIGDKAKDPRKVWDTPAARDLLRQSIDEAEPAQRQQIFDELHRQFMADVPAVILFNTSRIAAVRQNVTGYKGWPAAQQRLWGVGLEPPDRPRANAAKDGPA
ncbi:ABC transporter substrate-binding protein [Niveispirillum sp.]|uniref:ABC transporter substrate-binding protein n=1 Tax=Niveispirillum sp. TaxID=1917217 RepID=UPI001B7AA239|nr:ABC transporter substrate-binding protein [Niveispirillum sp.]MBP7338680.1 ABC transporter substrate-binding protein [Niveispirillum sp.]